MRVVPLLLCALTALGCSFDSGGVPADDAAVVDAPSFDANPDLPDADPDTPDAVVFDAPLPDAEPSDAPPPDANPCDKCLGTCNLQTMQCELIIVFRQGRNGYSSSEDTFLAQSSPMATSGNSAVFEWDDDDPPSSGNRNVALIRFGDLFGSAANQIPATATITSAKLQLTIVNGSTSTEDANLHVSLVSWTEGTASWSNFGGEPGVQGNETSQSIATIPPVACATCPATPVPIEIDVTASVQGFQSSPSSNLGWVIVPAGNDGHEAASSESPIEDIRPRLTVDYTVPL